MASFKVGSLRTQIDSCVTEHPPCNGRGDSVKAMLDQFSNENYDLDLPILNGRLKGILMNPEMYDSPTVDQALIDTEYILMSAKKDKDAVQTVTIIPKPWDPANYNTHTKKAVMIATRIDNTQYMIRNPVDLRLSYGVLNAHQCIEVDGSNGPARHLTKEEYKTIYDALPEQTRRDIWTKTKGPQPFPGD